MASGARLHRYMGDEGSSQRELQHSKHGNRSYLQPSLFISRTFGTSLIVADRKHAQIDTDG